MCVTNEAEVSVGTSRTLLSLKFMIQKLEKMEKKMHKSGTWAASNAPRLATVSSSPLTGGPIHSCKFRAGSNGDVPPARRSCAGQCSPLPLPTLLTTGNPLGKHPGTITINPTPGNTPRPRTRTKTSLSITGESYSPTNGSFLACKSSGPLSHYALEVAEWGHHPRLQPPQLETWVLVCEQHIALGVCFRAASAFSASRTLFHPVASLSAFTTKYPINWFNS